MAIVHEFPNSASARFRKTPIGSMDLSNVVFIEDERLARNADDDLYLAGC
jgi:hypothetical protein